NSVIFGKDLLVMPDGKILVAGYSFLGGNSHNPRALNHFTLIKYRADGSLDPSFAGAGFLRLDQTHNDANDSGFYSLALQSDGKILAGGHEDKNINNEWIQRSSIARFNPDGSIDSSFGTNGFVEFSAGAIRVPVKELVEVNGKVLALLTNGTFGSYLYRFNSNGTLDPTFFEAGRADLSNLPGAYGTYFDLTIDSLSNIWLGGTFQPEKGFNVIKVESN
ncbi:MAG: delta-60 repeat domain-containing protein, partial [Pseudobdellovibrionaceae bacterium]